ncbi:MAG: hypothetical protein PHV30_05250 [Candidatus Margulisbacteria bacterium]|nr:hypothetical protein [Candidatus Margulisiibacteriota bacterium]
MKYNNQNNRKQEFAITPDDKLTNENKQTDIDEYELFMEWFNQQQNPEDIDFGIPLWI